MGALRTKRSRHKCERGEIGFAKVVDYILESSKAHMHKADSRVMKGVLLGYEWRTTEYVIGTVGGIFKCRTVRRHTEEIAYDPECMDCIKVSYDDYTIEGARTTSIVKFAQPKNKVKMLLCPHEVESIYPGACTRSRPTT